LGCYRKKLQEEISPRLISEATQVTYCIAWKKKNEIFFISDSATSTAYKEVVRSESFMSFGELEDKYNRYYVYERHNKITILNERYIICFAGNMTHGYEMIRILEECLSLNVALNNAIQIIFNSTIHATVDMIIGYESGSEYKLCLLKDGKVVEGDIFEIGSGSQVEEWSAKVRKWLGYESINNGHLLAIMTSLVQIYSVKYHMVNFGVGGTVTGLKYDKEGLHWSSDINYTVLSPDQKPLGFITTIIREGILITFSSFSKTIKYLLGYNHNRLSRETILEKNQYIEEELLKAETDYLVLTNLHKNKMVVLYIGGNLHNQLFRMWRRSRGGETDYLLVYGGFIHDLLFTSLHGDDDEMTLHFADITANGLEYVSLEEFEKWTGGRGNVENTEDYF